MNIVKSRAVVLSSRIINESDIVSTVFTDNFGKRDFVFKGLKKSKRRAIPASEPGSLIYLLYANKENKKIFTAREFDLIKYFPLIRKSIDKLFSLYQVLEIVQKTVGFNNPNGKIFLLLQNGLQLLASTPFSFLWKLDSLIYLLKMDGILDNNLACSSCGKKISSGFSFHRKNLTYLCMECSERNVYFDSTVVSFLQDAFTLKFDLLVKNSYNEDSLNSFWNFLVDFIENYFSIELKSRGIL